MIPEMQQYSRPNNYRANYTVSTFEKLTFTKQNYILYWFFVASFAFFSSLAVLNYSHEKMYIVTNIFMVFGVYLWPIEYISRSNKFYELFTKHLGPLFWKNKNDAFEWYKKTSTKTFCIMCKDSFWITLFLWVFAVGTVFYLKLPFKSEIVSYIAKIGFAAVLMIGIPSINVLYHTFLGLVELSKREVYKNYFADGYIHFLEIKKYYLNLVWLIIGINITLFLGFYNSPYVINNFLPIPLLIWIIFISCWPTVFFFGVKYYLDQIRSNMKFNQISQIDIQVMDKKLDFTKSILNSESLKEIQEYMEFRKYLLSYEVGEKSFTNYIISAFPVITCLLQLAIVLLSKR